MTVVSTGIEHKHNAFSLFKNLITTGVNISVYMLAPLVLVVLVNRYLGRLDDTIYSNFALLSKVNITAMITFSGILQALYFFLGQKLGAKDQSGYQSFLLSGMILSVFLGFVLSLICLFSYEILSYLEIPVLMDGLFQQMGIAYAVGMIPYAMLVVIGIHFSMLKKANVMAMLYLFGAAIGILLVYLIDSSTQYSEMTKAKYIVFCISISYFVVILCALTYIFLKREMRFRWKRHHINQFIQNTAGILKVGSPIAFIVLMESFALLFSTLFIGKYYSGDIPLQAVLLLLFTIFGIIPIGLAQATSQFIAISDSQGNFGDKQKIYWCSIIMNLLWGGMSLVVFIVWPDQLLGFFLGDTVTQYTGGEDFQIIMILFGIMLISQCMVLACAAKMRGIGQTHQLILPSILGYIILNIGGQYLFGNIFSFGTAGVWMGLASSISFSAIYVLVLSYCEFDKPSIKVLRSIEA